MYGRLIKPIKTFRKENVINLFKILVIELENDQEKNCSSGFSTNISDMVFGNGLVVKEKNTTCTYSPGKKGEFTSVFQPHNHKTRK